MYPKALLFLQRGNKSDSVSIHDLPKEAFINYFWKYSDVVERNLWDFL